jgi:hypothetical protein
MDLTGQHRLQWNTKSLARFVLRQRTHARRQASVVEQLQQRIAVYEQTYGIRSDCLHQAIRDGNVIETGAVCHWIMDYDRFQKIERAKRRSVDVGRARRPV